MKTSAFAGCPMLKEFEIPTGVQIIGQNAVTDSKLLKEMVIPENVEEIMFGLANLFETKS